MEINREVALWAMAEQVEQAAGLLAGKPFRDAYSRVAYSRVIRAKREEINNAEIDRLLAAGALLLKEMSES